MRCVVAEEPGGPDALTVVERAAPEPGPGEVLIEVEAAGVNRADILQRQGLYNPPPGATPVLGLECAGTIREIGPNVSRPGDADISIGMPVCALLSGGGYAEYATVPAGQVAPIPAGLSAVDAAGIMEVAATVWSNLFMAGNLQAGETLLTHGGASGIGTMAIQVAKAYGAHVVVTAGSAAKLDACRSLGADIALDYTAGDFAGQMRESGLQADVILDIIGAKYLKSNMKVLADSGRLIVIGLQGGVKTEVNLNHLLTKRAAIMATSLRGRPADQKADIVTATVAGLWPLIADGTIRPIIDRTMNLDDVADAHRALEDSTAIGKIVLTVQ